MASYYWRCITGIQSDKRTLKKFHYRCFSIESPPASRGDIDKYINVSVSGNITKLKKINNIFSFNNETAKQCAMYYDQTSWLELRKLLIVNKYDIIIFQLIRLEYLIKKTIDLREKNNLNVKVYCDYVDALSLNMKNRAATENFLMRRICNNESNKLALVETKVFDLVDESIIISERDANYIGKSGFQIVPNGVNIPIINYNERKDKDNNLINLAFWGNMSYYPNVKAALYLAELLKKLKFGKYKLHIIGANPSKKIKALDAQSGIKIHGYVKDLNGLLRTMDLAVFPIFDGSGLQNKVLEAFALQIPVITTNIVLDSMPKLRAYAMEAKNKEDFIHYIESFSPAQNMPHLRNSSALQVLKEHYNWNVIINLLGSI
ncbi:glycosyltransferase family 4 protein [Citrobacter sp. Cs237]|uniref:glycosyltransferase n=1 Tax=Citrobacter sp. Cs237 TaxID=2985156 RepID=UPI002578B40C|nr:glycosyltransferase [Citrobacter sp. Cs237]MDM2748556.1 glycosyltransferase family 4 protein [Citrobacter sp. Cs237]